MESSLTDEELAVRAQRSKEAFGELFRRYYKRFFNLAYRFCGDSFAADDLTSEIFLRINRYLKSFKQNLSFKTWAYKVATNTCLTYKVKSAKFKVQSFSSKLKIDEDGEVREFEVEDEKINLVQEVINNNISSRVQKALGELPQKPRLALYLFYFEDLKYEEIAQILKMPVNTVRTNLRRGRIKLQEELRDLIEI